MNIKVGDRVTYKIDKKDIVTLVMNNIANIDFIINNDEHKIEILKIERPKYEVIEEKKELLTEEEKEFLKQYIKIIESLNNGEVITIQKQSTWLILKLKTQFEYQAEVGPRFKELAECKMYTLEELGL